MSRSRVVMLTAAERAERKHERTSRHTRRANVRRAHTRHGVITLALREHA